MGENPGIASTFCDILLFLAPIVRTARGAPLNHSLQLSEVGMAANSGAGRSILFCYNGLSDFRRRVQRSGLVLAILALAISASSSVRTALAAPPTVTVVSPNGSEVLQAGTTTSVTWIATDDGTIAKIDLYYLDEAGANWTQIAAGLANTGTFDWFVHNTPSTTARFRVVATDNNTETGEDTSDADFTILQVPGGFVPTTLRDFEQPGTQPFQGGSFSGIAFCGACHQGYDSAVEPGFNWGGSMMAQAARDPLFYACVAIAEQDVPSSGDLCIRCHSPNAWLHGRSNPTDASALTAADREGVSCDFCHSLVDPIYEAGVSPVQDLAILSVLDEVPTNYSNGQYVIDPGDVRRGPFSNPAAPHAWLESPFHRSSDLCGTCHNVSNPAFERISGQEYEANPFDEPGEVADAIALPVERTYSEWQYSDFPGGVFAPEFAGAKPDGIVSTCQDCHMQDVVGRGCGFESAPIRNDLPLHDFTGGNVWMPPIIAQIYPGEVNLAALEAASDRARDMLSKAALLDLLVTPEADSFQAEVTVTNKGGHKLPTGYAEGRRMWINLQALDETGTIIYESAAYDFDTADLTHDEDARIYEIEMGISHRLAAVTGLTPGASFHFVLNDSVYKDNRIPPLGFDNANYDLIGAAPVDPDWSGPGDRYPDGQNWDVATYGLPSETFQVVAKLYYQTVSKEYIEFLRDENTTNSAGDDMFALWVANDKAPPVEMVADTAFTVPVTDVPEVPAPESLISVTAGPNPFSSEVAAFLALPRATEIRMEVYDTQGRRRAFVDGGLRSAGTHRLVWDGVDENGHDAGSGIFWLRVFAGENEAVRRVVRVR